MTALLTAMVTLYLGFHASRMDPRPEDRKEGEIADGAGELGFFPPYSWWPLWCALALGVIVYGVALSRLVAGHHRLHLGAVVAVRLGLRVLPGRARPLSRAAAWEFRKEPVRAVRWTGSAVHRSSGGHLHGGHVACALARQSTRARAPSYGGRGGAAGALAPAAPRAAQRRRRGRPPAGSDDAPGAASRPPSVDPVRLTTNFTDPRRPCRSTRRSTVRADGGTLRDVTRHVRRPAAGRGRGRADGTWTADRPLLEPAPTTRSSGRRRPAPTAAASSAPAASTPST